MFASIILAVSVAFIATLLRIESKRNPAASLALWVPTTWMLISGSRSVSRWLALDEPGDIDYEAGSLPDRLVLTGLVVLAMFIVSRRKIDWARVLKENLWLIALFLYMAASILWVDHPFVSLKRWVKSAGPIMMAFVILSEAKPFEALEGVFRRCAYVLIPLSLVLIKYYPTLGRVYGRWDGLEMWTGTTTHKNSLGQLCALSVFFLIWSLLRRDRARGQPVTTTQIGADLSVLAIAAYLLRGPGTYSATAISITLLGLAVFFLLRRRERLASFTASNLRVLVVASVLLYLVVGDIATESVTSMLGRQKNLTGRATDIWPVVLEAASRHPILGLGYGGAWGLGNSISSVTGVEQAHNGYLDVYLQLGLLGILLLSAFLLLTFCNGVRRKVAVEFDWGIFGISFLVMTLFYNLSETAFFDVYLGNAMVLLPIVFSARRRETPDARVVEERLRQSPIQTPPRWRRPAGVPGRAGVASSGLRRKPNMRQREE